MTLDNGGARAPDKEPSVVTEGAATKFGPAETLATSAILDIMTGGYTGWRARIDESDMLQSADWQQASLYARAALSAGVPALISAIARAEQQLAYGQSHVAEKILQDAIGSADKGESA